MSITDKVIAEMADAFAAMGGIQDREIYAEGLKQVAMLAEAELINRMQLQYVQMSIPIGYQKH
jgi:hypothetical protein